MDAGVQVDASEMADLAPLLNENGPPARNNSTSYYRSPSRRSRKHKLLCALSLLAMLSLLLLFAYNCSGPDSLCAELKVRFPSASSSQSRPTSSPRPPPGIESRPLPTTVPVNLMPYDVVMHDNFEFELDKNDVMVFLHIQKTGGTTFGKHLVQDIDLDEPCQCRKFRKRPHSRQYAHVASRDKRHIKCECLRPGVKGKHWLFSRYSTGWKCGLHPDWTELTACVDNYLDSAEGHVEGRRYFYVSFLRDPVARYLSEYRHVQRGATWKGAKNVCNGRAATDAEIPACYDDEDWMGVELAEFMACSSNLALNRQTRMLADLRLVNCYNSTGVMTSEEREATILQSAKENLMKLTFFGLTEHQQESQYLFEETFNLRFHVKFDQHAHDTAHKTEEELSDETLGAIAKLNHLDVQLYDFAKKVMFERFEALKAADEDFELRFGTLGTTKTVKNGVQTFVENEKKMFSFEDIEKEEDDENKQ